MMYMHSNNQTDKTINVSKIANTSTLDDNSTAGGCNSRLMIIHTRVVDSESIRIFIQHTDNEVTPQYLWSRIRSPFYGYIDGDSDVRFRSVFVQAGFRRHLVGKTIKNAGYCNSA